MEREQQTDRYCAGGPETEIDTSSPPRIQSSLRSPWLAISVAQNNYWGHWMHQLFSTKHRTGGAQSILKKTTSDKVLNGTNRCLVGVFVSGNKDHINIAKFTKTKRTKLYFCFLFPLQHSKLVLRCLGHYGWWSQKQLVTAGSWHDHG